MGKSQLIRYIVRDDNARTLAPWTVNGGPGCRGYGRPTVQNLMKWRDNFNLSLFPGGANEHLGRGAWIQRRIHIFDQHTGRAVVSYNPPSFEVIPTPSEAATERASRGMYSRQTATA